MKLWIQLVRIYSDLHQIIQKLLKTSVVYTDAPESVYEFHCKISTFYFQKEWEQDEGYHIS